MNTIDFTHSGGFPLETDTLDFLQKSMAEPINALAGLAGDNYIISGVQEQGFRTTDGWVVIAGEVLRFKGDLKQDTVIIVQSGRKVHFEDGKERDVYLDRYATFGTGLKSIAFASLARVSDLQQQKQTTGELQNAHDAFKLKISQELKANMDALKLRINTLEQKAAPFASGGGMVLWQKPANQIPAGWREVADWRGRMPVGWDPSDTGFDTLGEIGGSKQVKIEKTHLPKIQLSTGVFYNSQDYVDSDAPSNNIGTRNNGNPVKTETLGDGFPLSIMNPYRIVLFIEYVGLA